MMTNSAPSYLLDTNVLLSLGSSSKSFGPKFRNILRRSPRLFYCSLSVAEIELKRANGKLLVADDFYSKLTEQGFRSIDFDQSAALQLARFSGVETRDPFDLMLLAQAAQLDAKLATFDGKLLSSGLEWVLDPSE